MKRQEKIKNKISWKLIVTSVLVVIFAMLMEFGILVYINNKSSEKTSPKLFIGATCFYYELYHHYVSWSI